MLPVPALMLGRDMAELIKIILDSSSGFSMPGEKKVSTFLNHYSYQIARRNIDAFAAVDHIL